MTCFGWCLRLQGPDIQSPDASTHGPPDKPKSVHDPAHRPPPLATTDSTCSSDIKSLSPLHPSQPLHADDFHITSQVTPDGALSPTTATGASNALSNPQHSLGVSSSTPHFPLSAHPSAPPLSGPLSDEPLPSISWQPPPSGQPQPFSQQLLQLSVAGSGLPPLLQLTSSHGSGLPPPLQPTSSHGSGLPPPLQLSSSQFRPLGSALISEPLRGLSSGQQPLVSPSGYSQQLQLQSSSSQHPADWDLGPFRPPPIRTSRSYIRSGRPSVASSGVDSGPHLQPAGSGQTLTLMSHGVAGIDYPLPSTDINPFSTAFIDRDQTSDGGGTATPRGGSSTGALSSFVAGGGGSADGRGGGAGDAGMGDAVTGEAGMPPAEADSSLAVAALLKHSGSIPLVRMRSRLSRVSVGSYGGGGGSYGGSSGETHAAAPAGEAGPSRGGSGRLLRAVAQAAGEGGPLSLLSGSNSLLADAIQEEQGSERGGSSPGYHLPSGSPHQQPHAAALPSSPWGEQGTGMGGGGLADAPPPFAGLGSQAASTGDVVLLQGLFAGQLDDERHAGHEGHVGHVGHEGHVGHVGHEGHVGEEEEGMDDEGLTEVVGDLDGEEGSVWGSQCPAGQAGSQGQPGSPFSWVETPMASQTLSHPNSQPFC